MSCIFLVSLSSLYRENSKAINSTKVVTRASMSSTEEIEISSCNLRAPYRSMLFSNNEPPLSCDKVCKCERRLRRMKPGVHPERKPKTSTIFCIVNLHSADYISFNLNIYFPCFLIKNIASEYIQNLEPKLLFEKSSGSW